MQNKNSVYLKDILDSIKKIEKYTRTISKNELPQYEKC